MKRILATLLVGPALLAQAADTKTTGAPPAKKDDGAKKDAAKDGAKDAGKKDGDKKANPMLKGAQKCCKGEDAACKACADGKSKEDYCKSAKDAKGCPKKVDKKPPTSVLCKDAYDKIKADFTGKYNTEDFKKKSKTLEAECKAKWERCSNMPKPGDK